MRQTLGDIERLTLRPHRWRMGSQIARCRDEHMCGFRCAAQQFVLPHRRFNTLNRVKVAIFTQQQFAQHGNDSRAICASVELLRDCIASRIHLLLPVE